MNTVHEKVLTYIGMCLVTVSLEHIFNSNWNAKFISVGS